MRLAWQDRFYVKRLSLPELAEVGSQSFHEIIFNAVKREVRTAILELIRREREGEIVDRKLVKEVVDVRASPAARSGEEPGACSATRVRAQPASLAFL